MWQARVFSILARALSVMLCWLVLMGLPLVFFRPPLEASDLKQFLGVFYALLLFTGTAIGRAHGLKGIMLMAFPFLVLFTALGVHTLIDTVMSPWDKLACLNFFAIYGVVFLAWRLGRTLRLAANEDEQAA